MKKQYEYFAVLISNSSDVIGLNERLKEGWAVFKVNKATLSNKLIFVILRKQI